MGLLASGENASVSHASFHCLARWARTLARGALTSGTMSTSIASVARVSGPASHQSGRLARRRAPCQVTPPQWCHLTSWDARRWSDNGRAMSSTLGVHVMRNRPLLKQFSWFMLSALTITAAGLVARRVSTLLWSRMTGEAPPTQNY